MNNPGQLPMRRKKNLSLLTGTVICILAIGVAYIWAISLMDLVYSYRSPFSKNPPDPGEIIGTPATRSLVIVLVDALRYDTSLKSEVMPFLNQLRLAGASAMMHSRPPSYSLAGYTSLLTGAWPDISDGHTINVDYYGIRLFTQDDIFSCAYRANLDSGISASNWFERLVPQQALAVSYYTTKEDKDADRQVVDAALPWLRDGKYELVLIHLEQVDYAGHHEGGPLDPRWKAAATRVDGLIEEIASAMELRQDTLLIISDHGQIDRGGHGGQDPVVLLEPFILVGHGVVPGEYNDVQMVDVAPTVAILLGTSIPATSQGNPRFEMFDFTLGQIDRIKSVVAAQQTRLAQSYQEAIGQKVSVGQASSVVAATQAAMEAARETRLTSQRILQGATAIVIWLLFINLSAWHARPHFKWSIIGVGCYLVVFNIKYLLIDHKTYSLSSVVDQSNLITSSLTTTVIALFIGWLLFLLGTKGYANKPRRVADTTMKFILVSLAILSIPVLIHFAFNGFLVTWTLPDFLTSFLGLIFLIQILMVAAFGLFLTAVSALIGLFARVST